MTVPSGEGVLNLLPALRRALDGTGPALLPLGERDPRSADIARALGEGLPLDDGEDESDDPTALVIATSGSTGAPKGVLLSAGQLAASAAATEERLGGAGDWLLALPAHHIAGMQVLLRAARSDSCLLAMDLDKPFAAADFATLAQKLPGPRRYVSLVPTQLARVVADSAATEAAAGLFDAILVGGAATPPRLLETARAAGLSIVTTYGMSETCGGCVYDGAPLGTVTAGINAAGTIVLSGPMVARGYRGRRSDPAFAAPGSFITSDTGSLVATGEGIRLVVTGRRDDIIVSGGVKVAPAAVESAIRGLPGIADVIIVGVPDPQWGEAVTALVVPEPDSPTWSLTGLRAALTTIPTAHRPHRLVAIQRIPLLPSGKPDRAAARQYAATR